MIAFVKGKVASYGADWVVVDCHDIGYQMAYPHPENLHLNDEVFIYTYLHITENDMSLFGFESQDEKALFLKLISVKGLGPKTAMGMLSKCGYQSIVSAIETGDVTLLKKMPGIGAKSTVSNRRSIFSESTLNLPGPSFTILKSGFLGS